jgi:cytochrome c
LSDNPAAQFLAWSKKRKTPTILILNRKKEVMKKLILTLGTLLFAGHAMAADAPAKLEMPADGKAKCGACHTLDVAGVGPAWKDVAAKYKKDKNAEATLVKNISSGGKFGWYADKPMKSAMPPGGMGANATQIAALAKFIAVDMNKGAGKEAANKSHDHKK